MHKFKVGDLVVLTRRAKGPWVMLGELNEDPWAFPVDWTGQWLSFMNKHIGQVGEVIKLSDYGSVNSYVVDFGLGYDRSYFYPECVLREFEGNGNE